LGRDGNFFDMMLKGRMKMAKENDLRVFWIPQVPMKAFYVAVSGPDEAGKVLDILAMYDLFQFENNVKPDYSNMGGLEVFEKGEWLDWEDQSTGDSIDEYMEKHRELKP
jgi:hypothetical protein